MPPKKKKNKDEEMDKGKEPLFEAQPLLCSEEIHDLLRQLTGTLSQQTGSSTQQTGSSTQQTGSSTQQTGSSTQQTGSSTQSSIKKFESSTQKLQTGPSVQKSDKKTLQSYVQKLPSQNWSQTLAKPDEKTLALQAMTKQEYDLINHQYDLQLSKTPVPVSQKQMVKASSQALTIQPEKKLVTPYVQKSGKARFVCQVEPEFFEKTPNLTALKIFPSGWHFKPVNPRKTREYYELILIHSDSVSLSRKADPKDESLITHSTLQIKKVLTPSQWGSDLNKPRFWDIDFEPNGYSYWDYQDAWWKVFWDQNRFFKHSWFIYFNKSTKYQFPQWFLHWWDFFGVTPQVFPPDVIQAFEFFKQKFNVSVEPAIPVELHYFSKLSGAWIFSWQYSFSHQDKDAVVLPILQRIPFIRWWEKFQLKFLNLAAVDKWFKANPEYLCLSEQSIFLNQRARIQTRLVGVQSKQELVQQLGSIIQLLTNEVSSSSRAGQEPSASNSQAPDTDDEEELEITNLGNDS